MSAVPVEHVGELQAYAEAVSGCTRCRLAQGRTQVVFGAGNAHADLYAEALAGYLHLRENPNGFEAVRALLGNRDDNVVRNNYAFLAERSLIADAQASIGRTRARFALPSKDKRKDV